MHTFTATDEHGKAYVLHAERDDVGVSTRQPPTGAGEGMGRITTEGGRSVTRVGKGHYLLTDGTVLYSTDADAP